MGFGITPGNTGLTQFELIIIANAACCLAVSFRINIITEVQAAAAIASKGIRTASSANGVAGGGSKLLVFIRGLGRAHIRIYIYGVRRRKEEKYKR